MGQPVVHFEILGRDGAKLREYYGALFGWEINADNPMNYGIVDREQNLNPHGIGIGGGVAGYDNFDPHVTIYVEVRDVEAALAQAESLGGERVMGPTEAGEYGAPVLGLFRDPEGHLIGVVEPQ
jgi:predicted enzyme related to lactoylglutathione lyase